MYWYWQLLNIQTSQSMSSFRHNHKNLYKPKFKKPFQSMLPLETPSVLENYRFIN